MVPARCCGTPNGRHLPLASRGGCFAILMSGAHGTPVSRKWLKKCDSHPRQSGLFCRRCRAGTCWVASVPFLTQQSHPCCGSWIITKFNCQSRVPPCTTLPSTCSTSRHLSMRPRLQKEQCSFLSKVSALIVYLRKEGWISGEKNIRKHFVPYCLCDSTLRTLVGYVSECKPYFRSMDGKL